MRICMKTTTLKTIIILLAIATISGCKTTTATDESSQNTTIPQCITEKINVIKAAKVSNPPRSVWQFQYNGQTVYYVPPYCCDIYSELYDSQCNLICSPDGGLTGKGDGKCSDFSDKKTNEKLIWKDDRAYPPK